jgi:diguanylate cyclase (GGDEF)-like protein
VAGLRGIRAWPFWGLPLRLRAYIIGVALVAVCLTVWQARTTPPTISEFGVLGMFLACGVIVAETSRGFLRGVANQFRQDLNSVWKLPVLFLLPPFFALIAPVFFVLYWSRSVKRRTAQYRQVFSIATLSVGDGLASILFHFTIGAHSSTAVWVAGALGAALLSRAWNILLVGVVLWMTQPEKVRELWNGEMLAYVGVEICTGIVVAVLARQSLLLIVLTIPPVILLHRGLLHEQLRNMSRTDTKTAVLNAGAWEQDAGMELVRAKRANEPTSVLICDIDHFKRVNDQHGHLNGDMALRAVAQRLQALLRQGDILGRFGGEEFVILLSGIGMVNAKSIAERLRRNVANDPIQLDKTSIRLTVSLGVSTSESSHDTLPEMLAAADEALYVAKRRGRDRVVIARKLQSAENAQLDELAGSGGDAAGSAEPAESADDAPARRASG